MPHPTVAEPKLSDVSDSIMESSLLDSITRYKLTAVSVVTFYIVAAQ